MLRFKVICASLILAIYVCHSVADRPRYLTEEEFAIARLIPSAAVNGTVFLPPEYRKDHPVGHMPK